MVEPGDDSSSIRVMQWNLLATGLHKDGFVRGDLFSGSGGPDDDDVAGPTRLREHLLLTKEYRRLLEQELRLDLEAWKPLQHLFTLLLFTDAVTPRRLREKLFTDAAALRDRFKHVAEEEFVVLQSSTSNDFWAPLCEFFAEGVASQLVEDSVRAASLSSTRNKRTPLGNPYDAVHAAAAFFAEAFFSEEGADEEEPKLLLEYRAAFSKLEENPKTRNEKMGALVRKWAPQILTLQEVAPDPPQLFFGPGGCGLGATGGVGARGKPATPRGLGVAGGEDQDQDHQHALEKEKCSWMKIEELQELLSAKDSKDPARVNEVLGDRFLYRARKIGPAVCGVCVLVDREKFNVLEAKPIGDFAYLAVVERKRRPTTGSLGGVAPASEGSGDDYYRISGEERGAQISQILDAVDSVNELARNWPVILGMDGNYDQGLCGANYPEDSEAVTGGWALLRERGYRNWVELGSSGSEEVDIMDNDDFRDSHVVTVNKMRGMFSSQVAKWGEYMLRNIDYVFVRSTPAPSPDTGEDKSKTKHQSLMRLRLAEVCNACDLQRYSKRGVLTQLRESCTLDDILRLDLAAQAAQAPPGSRSPRSAMNRGFVGRLMPSGENPSDHQPVVLQLQLVRGS
eukprot:g5097.t1